MQNESGVCALIRFVSDVQAFEQIIRIVNARQNDCFEFTETAEPKRLTNFARSGDLLYVSRREKTFFNEFPSFRIWMSDKYAKHERLKKLQLRRRHDSRFPEYRPAVPNRNHRIKLNSLEMK